MKSIPLILLSIIFFGACNLNTSPKEKSSFKLDSIKMGHETTTAPKNFKGIYHPISFRFTNCDDGKIYSLKNNTVFDSLYKKILPNAYKDEPVYLEVNAITNPSDSNQIDFISGSKVLMEQKHQKNTCINSVFWCTGIEPFWKIQISEEENLIDFYNPMEQKTTHFLYSKPETKNGLTTFTSSYNTNNIKIIIKKEKCSGAIDPLYDYSVEVLLNEKAYNGCAETNHFQ